MNKKTMAALVVALGVVSVTNMAVAAPAAQAIPASETAAKCPLALRKLGNIK